MQKPIKKLQKQDSWSYQSSNSVHLQNQQPKITDSHHENLAPFIRPKVQTNLKLKRTFFMKKEESDDDISEDISE